MVACRNHSWFEESLCCFSYEKDMIWLLRSQLFMTSKILMAPAGLEPRYFSPLRLTYMFGTWLRIRGNKKINAQVGLVQ